MMMMFVGEMVKRALTIRDFHLCKSAYLVASRFLQLAQIPWDN
jgi:hypothetical protein